MIKRIEPVETPAIGRDKLDFPLPFEGANIAELSLTMRYPKSGFVRNNGCDMVVWIVEGNAAIVTQKDGGIFLRTGEMGYIEKGTMYYWDPRPTVKFLAFSVPAWTPEQHETIA